MVHYDFVAFDPDTLTITVNFQSGKSLTIHQHDQNLRISHYSQGHGGQNVNKHQNGVQLIYQIPETHRRVSAKTREITSRSNEQRHQRQNMILAFKHLASKLHDYFYIPPARISARVPHHAKIQRLQDKKSLSHKKEFRKKPEMEL